MKKVPLIVMLLAASVLLGGDESPSGGDIADSCLFDMITDISSDEERSWAKPIVSVDMDRMLELIETGLLTFHKADWFAEVDDE